MEIQETLQLFWTMLVKLATNSPLVVPFWAAVLWLILLLTRQWTLKGIFHLFGVDEVTLQRAIIARIDVPLQMLLVLLATAPFIRLIPGRNSIVVNQVAEFLGWFLALHVLIQSTYYLFFRWYLEQKKNVKIPGVFFACVLTLLYIGIILLLVNWIYNLNILPLLATSTVVTAVVGLAMQDTLRNIFAGLTVSLEQSFRQGDWVMFRQDVNNTLVGEIIEIGWRSTKIRTVNNNYIIIPNAQFTTNELINYNSPTPVHAREVRFPVSITAFPEEVRAAIEAEAAKVDGVLDKPVPSASAVEFSKENVVYQLRFWVDHFEKREKITSDVIERVWLKLLSMDAVSAGQAK
jgi:small-conductance mechanosensitive channel